MKKFANLLKKEIKELVNKQLVFTLLFMLVLYNFIGQVSKKEVQKIAGVQTISALDEDGSAGSQVLLKGLETGPAVSKALPKGAELPKFKIIDQSGKTKEQAIEAAKANGSKLLVVIPKGFGDSLKEFKPSQIETYSFMRTFSLIGASGQVVVGGLVSLMNSVLSDQFLKEKLPGFDPESLKAPINTKNYVIVRNHIAEGQAMDVARNMAQQSMLIPLVLMMIVIYSSQMVISAVAMEKQNKTLETLLTVPIKRTSIITAKMLAAGLVGLISAGVYMFAFKGFVGGMTAGAARAGGQAGDGSAALMRQLGLTFNTTGYIVLGLAMFLAILVALALAMILGVLAEDFRSAQTMIMPLIFLVMIPYFISLFADMNSLSLPVKILILAIPFTHPFLVSQNLYVGNWGMIAFGLGYMFVIFVVLTIIAARIFSTDKILTMKLRLGKKKALTA